MARTLVKIAALLGLGAGIGAIVFLLGLRTPWGRSPSPAADLIGEADGARARLTLRMAAERRADRVRLDEAALRDLALVALARRDEGRRVLRAARDLGVRVEAGRVEIGLLTDPERLRTLAAGEESDRTIEKILRIAPFLGEREVYLGVSGVPVASGDRLRLAEPRVRVAVVEIGAETLSERLGIDRQELDRALEVELSGVSIRSLEVEEGAVVVRLERG